VIACRKCGFEIPNDDAQFCSRCGTKTARQNWFWPFLLALRTALRRLRRHRPPVWRGYRTARGKLRASRTDGEIATFGKNGRRPSLKGYELSASARKIYWYLFHIADDGGYCWPFYKTIARRTRLSTSTVGKAIKELEAVGLISHKQRASRRGASSNLYRVRRPSR
jgi:hypothetical protein